MSIDYYAIINASNTIVNKVIYYPPNSPPNPHPAYPDCTFIKTTAEVGMSCDGWTYVNGEFIAPPIVPIEPIIIPTPTMADLQAQMAQIQMHMSTLIGQS